MGKNGTTLKAEARAIGARQGLYSALGGVGIAQTIMAILVSSDEGVLKGFFWFLGVSYVFNLVIGVICLLASGAYFGGIAGVFIIVRKRSPTLIGFLCGMAVLATTGFLSGWTGFFQHGIKNSGMNETPFQDYIIKPLFWIVVVGFIPALIVGGFMGDRIARKGKRLRDKKGSY